MAPRFTTSQQLEAIASRVHSLAFDFADHRRPHYVTDHLITQVEQAAQDLRIAVRGR